MKEKIKNNWREILKIAVIIIILGLIISNTINSLKELDRILALAVEEKYPVDTAAKYLQEMRMRIVTKSIYFIGTLLLLGGTLLYLLRDKKKKENAVPEPSNRSPFEEKFDITKMSEAEIRAAYPQMVSEAIRAAKNNRNQAV